MIIQRGFVILASFFYDLYCIIITQNTLLFIPVLQFENLFDTNDPAKLMMKNGLKVLV
jgi:hypothetical protein